jgi:hypothetical protein
MSTDLTTESSIYLAIIMAFLFGANFEPGERLQATEFNAVLETLLAVETWSDE